MTEADNFLTFQRQSTSSKVPSLPFSLAVMFQSTVHLKVLKKEVTDDQDSRSEEVTLDSDKRDSFEAMPILGRLTRELGSVLQKHRQNYHGVIKYKRTLFMKKGLTHSCLGKHGITRRLGILTPEGHDKLNRDTLATWMPDMTLPLSFCSDRYWLVQTANGLLPQQVQNQVCRNSDSGHGGLIVEKDSSVFRKLPLLLSGQVNRHAEETNRQLEWSKPPERSLLRTELILQSPHDDAYELQAVTRFSSVVKCLVACGFAVSLIGGCVSAGVNSFVRNRWPKVTVGGGGMIAQNEVSYGGYLEAFFEDNQYPLSPFVSTAGLSIIKLREDVAIDGNIQVQVPLGRTAVVGQACLNNVKTGEIRIRTSSSNQLCMALLGFLPVLCALVFNRSANFRSSH